MSEPKLISPMLDNFDMGNPISDHNGIRCCPAMKKESDDKYIVKIISIPASQTQLDALLLSGAYPDAQTAAEYFKTLAKDIIGEAELLDNLSRLEGFLPYENWQLVEMDDGTGYDIYLLSAYRKTLAQLFRHNAMTHLEALNLGLDLCAALTVCRRSGYLYVDLKPENVYRIPEGGNKIGDIGFIALESLRFASLPERCRSPYTPPEISDAFAALNTTIDVYAVGMILYQAFNDGLLPVKTDDAQDAQFAPPAYADYEMAEIILKACDPDPAKRWQDPVEMGQALVSYMQRNGAHDTPIVPVPVTVPEEADVTVQEEEKEDVREAVSEASEPDREYPVAEAEIYTETEDGNLSFLSDDYDETAPEESEEEIDYNEISNEVSDILVQADELISHPAPDPVIPPEPIDVPVPPMPPAEPEETEDESQCEPEEEHLDDSDRPEDSEQEHESAGDAADETPKRKHHWVRNTIIGVILAATAFLGILFYVKYYLQPIHSIILQEHDNGDLTVFVSSPVDDAKLTVICSDTYGNQLTMPLTDGQAVFTGLAPDTAYTVKLAINGFHKLTGDTSAAFTTPVQTNIVQLQAVTGAEDGSVILSFTVDGPDSPQWQISYSSADSEEQTTIFAGHFCTIKGLTVGTEYKFTLVPVTNLNYTGTNVITHVASKIVKADSLRITGCIDGVLTAAWSVSDDTDVESWTVRCYSDNGYDKTTVVTEPAVSFDEVDSAASYTIEVTASGMSVGERGYAAANSITITDFKADTSKTGKILLSWNSRNFTPEKGWLLMYTVDGSPVYEITDVKDCAAELTTIVPGAKYTFKLQAVDGPELLGGQLDVQTADAKSFSGYGVSAKHMEFKMCETPSKKKWDRYDLSSSDYTTTFTSGEKASFLVRMTREYNTSKDNIKTLFVVRDESGKLISISSTSAKWTKMWYRNYCELDIPSIPKEAGNYTISIYFNGMLAHTQSFTVKA